jgi:nicotinate phosphoribosyltransferase
MFHTADEKAIRTGQVADVYYRRTMAVLDHVGRDPVVKAEFTAKGLPWPWAVLAGIEELVDLLKGLDVKVRILPEGTIIRAWEPVLEIEGRYREFGGFETTMLGLICQASGVATMAARCKVAARPKPVISFGARRLHPAIAPMIERNAYIGGCDGVAVGLAADLVGIEPTGTIPHALILIMGDTVEAAKAFNQAIEPEVQRVILVDTFQDEQFEAVRVARALGDDLFAVRLDTPGSRRGNFARLIEEVRWELDAAGFSRVKLFVSGGLDEERIQEINHVADAYGVGTAVSAARVVDFSMDLVEVEGKPLAKRGKRSGSKSLLVCDQCQKRQVTPFTAAPGPCSCGGPRRDLLQPLGDPLAPGQVRDHVLAQLETFNINDL